jgi:Mn2+/Fe2+ NRAMP family transporter
VDEGAEDLEGDQQHRGDKVRAQQEQPGPAQRRHDRLGQLVQRRFLGYERADTALGTPLFAVGALSVLLACGFAFGPASAHRAFTDAAATARGLRTRAGGAAGALFAVVPGAGSVLGASAVTLATSHAVGDYFGPRHSLHRRWREARTFHRTYAAGFRLADRAGPTPY